MKAAGALIGLPRELRTRHGEIQLGCEPPSLHVESDAVVGAVFFIGIVGGSENELHGFRW
jgi:hypothetical protein